MLNIDAQLQKPELQRELNANSMICPSGILSSHNIKTVIFDCDGVIWKGKEIISSTVRTIKNLQILGINVLILTNSSMYTREKLRKRLRSNNVDVPIEKIYTATYLTGLKLKKLGIPPGSLIHMIGNPALKAELIAFGYKVHELEDKNYEDEGAFIRGEPDPKEIKAVVLGECNTLTTSKFFMAYHYLAHESQPPFIITNPDPVSNTSVGIFPEVGAFALPLTSTIYQESIWLGKPSRSVGEMLIEEHNLVPKETLMIGDRLNTDILFATNSGFYSVLVLSGVTKIKELTSVSLGQIPTYIYENVEQAFAIDVEKMLQRPN